MDPIQSISESSPIHALICFFPGAVKWHLPPRCLILASPREGFAVGWQDSQRCLSHRLRPEKLSWHATTLDLLLNICFERNKDKISSDKISGAVFTPPSAPKSLGKEGLLAIWSLARWEFLRGLLRQLPLLVPGPSGFWRSYFYFSLLKRESQLGVMVTG